MKSVAVAAGGYALSQVIGGFITCYVQNKKVKQQEKQNNQMNSYVLNTGEVHINAGIENAYVSSWSSKVDITIARPSHERMTLEIYAVLSDINIYYPNDVKVIMDGQEFVHRKECGETEILPEIYIHKNAAGAKINLKVQDLS